MFQSPFLIGVCVLIVSFLAGYKLHDYYPAFYFFSAIVPSLVGLYWANKIVKCFSKAAKWAALHPLPPKVRR